MATDATADTEADDMDFLPPSAERSSGFRQWQIVVFVFPHLVLGACVLAQLFQRPDYIRLLWIDPMGLKMLGAAATLLFVGPVVYWGGCFALNRVGTHAVWEKTAGVLNVLLVLAWGVFFVFPVASVVTIGPAAIQIQREMLKP